MPNKFLILLVKLCLSSVASVWGNRAVIVAATSSEDAVPFTLGRPALAHRRALSQGGGGSQVTVGGPDGNGDYETLLAALDAGEDDVLVLDGVHDVHGTIRIERSGVRIIGTSRDGTVLRKTGSASFILVVNAEDVTVANLTLDAKTFDNDSNQIWEAFGTVNCNRTVLRSTTVLGSDHMFAVYFAGSADTIDAFNDGRMDSGNVLEDNIIHSDYSGGALTFKLQKNGRVSDNTITGGSISLAMNRDLTCSGNTVEDSASAGIYVKVPAENNVLDGNTVLRSQSSGIVVRRRNGQTPTSYRAPGISIRSNRIEDSRFMGIEVDQTMGAVIEGNVARTPDFSSIYLLRTDGAQVVGNSVEDFGQSAHRTPIHGWSDSQNSGIYGDYATTGATIKDNIVVNAGSEGARFGIKIAPWGLNTGSLVANNTIMGSFTFNPVDVPLGSNAVEGNSYTEEVEVSNGGDDNGDTASAPATVGPNGAYATLTAALDAGESNVLILDGVHDIHETIKIQRPNVQISGESRDGTVLRKIGPASFILVVDTENVTVANLTLDAKTFDSNSNQIWEAFGCVNCNHTTLRGATILGSMHMFAVFFAGPGNQFDAGQATIDAFDASWLDVGNVCEDNIIHSDFPGDVLSFSLQKSGRVTGNTVVGGVISFFMNKDSTCDRNTVNDSNTAGIFISVPAENNLLEGNTVRRSTGSGIVVRRQIDHRDGADGVSGSILTPTSYRAPGIVIQNNLVEDSRFMGIEIDQTVGAVVEGNTVMTPDFHGIYFLRTDNPQVLGNRAEDFGQSAHRVPIHGWSDSQNAGIYGDYALTGAVIENNTVVNSASEGARFGIKIAPWTENFGSLVVNNTIQGSLTYVAVDVPPGSNVAEHNTILP